MTEAPVDFARETLPRGEGGRYELTVGPHWRGMVGGGVFGGMAAALPVRAAGLEAHHPIPAALSCHFLRPLAVEAPVRFEVDRLKEGRRTEVLDVRVSQDDGLAVQATVTAVAEPDDLESAALRYDDETDAVLTATDPDALPRLAAQLSDQGLDPARVLTLLHHVDYRNVEDTGDGVFRSWFRLGPDTTSADPWVEAARYLLALDGHGAAAFLRAGQLDTFRMGRGDHAVTSLDLGVHFHCTTGASDWLGSATRATHAAHGLVSSKARLTSRDGTPLATASSQLLVVPFRRS